TLLGHWLLLALAVGVQDAGGSQTQWMAVTSQEGNFVVDFPGKPTKSYTRQARTRTGAVKIIVVQCDTPDVLYTAEKIEQRLPTGLKPADLEAILDYWRDDLANDLNGKVVAQKRLRLDSGAYGRDFTIEGRPDPKAGLVTTRVREYLSQKVLYL